MSNRKQRIRKGLLSGIIIGSVVSAYMWYMVDDREKENLLAQQSPLYKAQVSLQRYREATVDKDSMGQLFHLQQAVDALGEAYKASPDDERRFIQQQNSVLQLARIRAELKQDEEALKLRQSVLELSTARLEAAPATESMRELSLAAFIDWSKTRLIDDEEVITAGRRLSRILLESFQIAAPLEQTRLATSDLHATVLNKMETRASHKTQLEWIDLALRSLMSGIDTTTQPLIYAIQVQKFINESKRIAVESDSHQLKVHFTGLNADWRKRRTLLEPLDLMAKVLLAEALIDKIELTPTYDETSVEEIRALIDIVKQKTKSDKELRRIFFAQSKLGAYLSKREMAKEATSAYLEALEVAKKFKTTFPDSLVTAYSNLGFLTRRSGEPKKAKALFDSAFETAQALTSNTKDWRTLWLKSYYRAAMFGSLKENSKLLNSLGLSAKAHADKLTKEEVEKLKPLLTKLRAKKLL